ncbi:hypothetical protein QZH41_012295 [Actinostola sp. cb2023]|nr:hypothetical protein QZH41_012295 [Actinostola sp. cb2023]
MVRHISGIGTQGYKSTLFGSYWVKSYAIEYSYNGYEWYWYKDNTASATPIKEFYANTDANTEKRIQFRDTFVTKYLRIYPIKFEDDMCLRVELYGCTNDKGVDNVFRAAACTGSSLSLDCSSKSIKILHAFYGALPFSTHCGSHGNESSCLASGMQQTVTTLCEHYKVCQVDISGPQFSLSCGAGLVPHVDVYYRCTGTVIKSK